MDITGTVQRLVTMPGRSVRTVMALPGQVGDVWGETTDAVRRAGRLLDSVEVLVARMELALDEVDQLTRSTWQQVERVQEVTEQSGAVAHGAGLTREHAEQQVQRLALILDAYAPTIEALLPLARKAGTGLRVAHVEALLSLLDRLPTLVDMFEPALDGMGQLVPHLQEVTGRMDNVGQVVEGLPGARALRRRGEAREAAAQDD